MMINYDPWGKLNVYLELWLLLGKSTLRRGRTRRWLHRTGCLRTWAPGCCKTEFVGRFPDRRWRYSCPRSTPTSRRWLRAKFMIFFAKAFPWHIVAADQFIKLTVDRIAIYNTSNPMRRPNLVNPYKPKTNFEFDVLP